MHQFPAVDIVIPPQINAQYQKDNAFYRNRNILEIQCYGKDGGRENASMGGEIALKIPFISVYD